MVETAGVALRTYIDWNTQNQGRGLTQHSTMFGVTVFNKK